MCLLPLNTRCSYTCKMAMFVVVYNSQREFLVTRHIAMRVLF